LDCSHKTKAIITLLLTALVLASPLTFLDTVQAAATISVESPVEGETCTSNNVNLKFSISHNYNNLIRFTCDVYLNKQLYSRDSLDGNALHKIDIILENLPQGENKIEISLEGTFWYDIGPGEDNRFMTNKFFSFFVDTGVAPSVSVLGFSRFDTGQDAIFNITTSSADADVFYSLNNLENVSLPKSQLTQFHKQNHYCINLTDLADGSYSFKAYAKDAMGNTGFAEKAFTVGENTQTPTQKPTDTPNINQPTTEITIFIIATIAGIAILTAAALLLLYRRKHKPNS
jgi:hypothetical protein